MAKTAAEKTTPRRRTEGEKAQAEYDRLAAAVRRKTRQVEKARALLDKHGSELADLETSRDFWGGHPAVRTTILVEDEEDAS